MFPKTSHNEERAKPVITDEVIALFRGNVWGEEPLALPLGRLRRAARRDWDGHAARRRGERGGRRLWTREEPPGEDGRARRRRGANSASRRKEKGGKRRAGEEERESRWWYEREVTTVTLVLHLSPIPSSLGLSSDKPKPLVPCVGLVSEIWEALQI
ncbi:hypothetical protein C8J57DRAFT_1231426 [Mycena rebaudengoi]|nr:hypothetical protein C8J57DRAFT_1231426 [Mycena rebaudengoi]